MKWGHHKSQVKVTQNNTHDNDVNDKKNENQIFTKRNVAIGAAAVVGALVLIGATKYVINKNSMPIHFKTMRFGKIADLDKMSTSDTLLKRGTEFHRISSKSIEDYTGEGKRIYASFEKRDNKSDRSHVVL